MDRWRLLVHPDLSGYQQMAIDEALYLLATPDSVPVLRFYTWQKPTLSLGFFQDYKRVVSEPFVMHNNIDVVRRITGGRAVLHQFEVTYALAGPLKNQFADKSLKETYRLIAEALNRGLASLGVPQAQFSKDVSSQESQNESRLPQCFVAVSRYEIAKDVRKIIGSAQKRSRDRFVQHGSILLDFDVAFQNGCILNPDLQIEKKVAPLNPMLGRALSLAEVSDHFKKAFEEQFQVTAEPTELEKSERDLSRSMEEKYQSAEWTERGCR
ncbi:lipoate--protein ligase family protein [bacterium]|nr:lipoate--protein ligase family protein [bacterium]